MGPLNFSRYAVKYEGLSVVRDLNGEYEDAELAPVSGITVTLASQIIANDFCAMEDLFVVFDHVMNDTTNPSRDGTFLALLQSMVLDDHDPQYIFENVSVVFEYSHVFSSSRIETRSSFCLTGVDVDLSHDDAVYIMEDADIQSVASTITANRNNASWNNYGWLMGVFLTMFVVLSFVYLVLSNRHQPILK